MKLSLDNNGKVSIEGKFKENSKIEKAINRMAELIGADFVTCLELDKEEDVSDWSTLYDMDFFTREDIKCYWKKLKGAL